MTSREEKTSYTPDNSVILHIANLTNDKGKGPNNNVPKNIIYGSRYAKMGLFNLKKGEIAYSLPESTYFSSKDHRSIFDLPVPFNQPQIVIFQGLYYIKYCKIAKQLRKRNIPYIIVPRCSMTTAGIRSHWLKKKVANLLFFNKFVANAKSVQFLAENEYLESKDNFRFKKYFILGNGVELPKKHYEIKNRKEFKIVFVGRYNVYHKGLDVLLESVKKHEKWFKENDVILELYGSDSDNGLNYLTDYIRKNHLEKTIFIKGPVFDEAKEKVLLDADVFIHTSRLEGQPTSVIEAISYGVPVIVTHGTNIADEVKENMLGYIADLSKTSIFNSIEEAFRNKGKLGVISKNEIRHAEEAFNWDTISQHFVSELSTHTRSEL